MTALDTSPSLPIARPTGKDLLRFLFFALTIAYATAFATMLVLRLWLWNSTGALVSLDFVDVYAAGKLVWAGHPADMYNWSLHRAAEASVLGHPVTWKDYLGWHYPPPFLFIATLLAPLPYVAAFLVWGLGTLPFYALVVRKIAGCREAWLAACAFPATFFNIAVGQNGFLTAALAGSALVLLETSPIASGVLVGLLTYKPQFGILFPLALLAGGYWRNFIAASMTALALATASWLTFGTATSLAFFHSLPVTVDAVLMRGMMGWVKLNSLYGAARWLGLPGSIASLLQGTTVLVLAVAVIMQWRSRMPMSLKAAGLIVASLLATPYLYVYDLPLLAVALAFLYRHRTFDAVEFGVTAIAIIALAAFPLVAAPTGLIALGLVTILVARRTLAVWHVY